MPKHSVTDTILASIDRHASTSSIAPKVAWHNKKILVVDDNPVNLEIAVETLVDAGASVSAAMNGSEALDHINTTAFDLVLLDLTMPDIDGHAVGRRMRASEKNGTASLLIFTASDAADAAAAVRELSAQGVVHKPMDVDNLLRLVDLQLRSRQHGLAGP